jgi:hypothetical protein
MSFGDDIAGYQEFVEWCSGWPSFHDSEIVTLELNRRAPSKLVIHVLGGPKPTFGPRSDSRYSSPPTDVVVTFVLEEIEDLNLEGFSHQNVIFALELEHDAGLFKFRMDPGYGLAGKIAARKVSIEFLPGAPVDK